MKTYMRKVAAVAGIGLVLSGVITASLPTAHGAAGGPQVDTKTHAFSSTGTATASVSSTVAGDLLVAFVSGDQPGSSGTQSATVSASGLTWTLAKRVDGEPGTAEVWWARASGTLSAVPVSATLSQIGSGGTNVELLVDAFDNAAGIGAVGGASASSGAPSAKLTTTAANSWVWGVGFDWFNGISRTVGSGQTLVDQVLQPGGTFWTQSQTAVTASSGSAVTSNDTAPAGDCWNLATVEVLSSPATAAPMISNVQATQITSSGATITWATDQAASSQVNYGTTASYGSASALNSNPVTAHMVTLGGLSPSTAYHYQAVSSNANGTTSSADLTFITSAPNQAGGPQLDTKSTAFSSTGTASTPVSTTAAGDLLVALVSGDQAGSTGTQSATVTSTGLTWSLAKRVNGQPGTAEIWSARASGALTALAVNATLSRAANVELVVQSFSNASGLGAVGGASASSGAPSASLTTTATNSWVYGVGFDWSKGIARTVGSGQTLVDQVLQPGGTFWTQSQTLTTPNASTAVAINDTAPTTDTWNLATVEVLTGSVPTAPVISTLAATQITSAGATITWSTDQPATSQVNYGTTASYGSSSPLSSMLVTSHSVTLTGLSPSTTYHYQAVSGDGNGTTSSGDAIFTTAAAAAPVISNVASTQITSSGATITWSTDQSATSQVNYGTTASYGSSSALNSTLVTSHSVTLTGLSPSTTYHYQAVSGNGNGTTNSGDFTFSTSPTNQGSGPQVDTKTTAFSATGSASASVTTTVAGDLLVAFVAGDQPGSSGVQTAALSSSGLTWTLVKRSNGVPGTAEIWWARAAGTLSSVVVDASLTQIASGGTNIELVVEAFSNATGIGAVGGASATSGAPTAPVTTTGSNSWVWGVGFDWTQGLARTVGSGQTLVDQVLKTGGTFWTQSETAVTPGAGTAVTINDTAPTTDDWNLASVEILSGSAQAAPSISNVAATQITSSGATITWTTNQSATSQVNYGLTASYGSSSQLDSNQVTSHSVTLTGLTAATTYHYAAVSSNGNGSSQSADMALTTSSVGNGTGPQLDTKATGFSSTGTATASVTTSVAGDLIVAFVAGDQPGSFGIQTASVSAPGLTWTLNESDPADDSAAPTGQPGTAQIWTARARGTLSGVSVTASLNQAANIDLVVETFSNAAGIGRVGGGSAASGAPTATLTTTAASSWVWGVGFDWTQGSARTVASGQTLVDQVLQTGGTFWTQSATAATPNSGTPVTINDTSPTGDTWNLGIAEILSATAPPPPLL